MELLTNNITEHIIDDLDIVASSDAKGFIEANTTKVSLGHLKNDCIIPVFSKDNETTISHYQFIDRTFEVIKDMLPDCIPKIPDIRVSHMIKGRTPSAIGKPLKELEEHEKTIYYERCAFLIKLSDTQENINGNKLSLTIGGVRSYSQENLYSKKTLEKFKVFIGYQNRVCTNLCVSTDGLANEIKIGSILELQGQLETLLMGYDRLKHLETMEKMKLFSLSEKDFAHLIGKMRLYQYMPKEEQKMVMPICFNDSQINRVVKDYYQCPNFRRDGGKRINLWNLYNLFTDANKSSYIDRFLERGANAYEFIQNLGISIENNAPNWYLNK